MSLSVPCAVRVPITCAMCLMEEQNLIPLQDARTWYCSCGNSPCVFSEDERRRLIDTMYLSPRSVEVRARPESL